MNNMTIPRVVAVIPAAGVGSRMQADRPKQYLMLGSKTILEHTIDALVNHPKIDDVVVAISAGDAYFAELELNGKAIRVVEGGKERADSVLNGIATLAPTDWALVHDAARPCVDEEDISSLLNVMNDNSVAGGILATPVRDTMKRATASPNTLATIRTISHTEERTDLWHALTPQLFPAGLLKHALETGLAAGANITDEASAMELAGHKVAMINGSPANIKITHPADLPLAEFYLQQKLRER
ncbi:2-C-methyl-D-erythritol 4-phosphate cytidylyltransferase [Alteromonas sp. KC3]|nr:2-C-methyl-D-erythritol 4-phosphate cytidylyltransferase [Alteromonas sp. KC3]BCO21633.1 2-C-methyl-D-erythritol 4-phosphate cytidylyltransferase [Alteromonas sp. KC14]